MRLAPDKTTFDAAIPGEYLGFIRETRKRELHFSAAGREYTANIHGLVLTRRRLECGRNFYQFCSSSDELFDRRVDERAFVRSLAIGEDARGLIFKGRLPSPPG